MSCTSPAHVQVSLGSGLSLGLELVGEGVCAFSHFQGFARLPSSMVTLPSELGTGSSCSAPPLVQSRL